MKLRKIYTFVLVLLLGVFLAACDNEEEKTYSILMPQGIPAIALGNLLTDANINFTIVDGPSVLGSELMNNNYDIIVAPVILGAQLYTKGKNNYKLQSVITEGNTFLVSKISKRVNDLKELEGKKIAAYGENTAPDITMKAALVKAGVDLSKVEIVYENSVSDVLSNRFLVDDTIDYILTAEPIVSKMKIALAAKIGEIDVIDLSEELKSEVDLIAQAGIYIRKDIETLPTQLLNKIKNNINKLNNETENYVKSLFEYDGEYSSVFSSLGESIVLTSIPNSSIVYKKAVDYKTSLDKYFAMINKYNSNILSGKEICEDFYQE